MLQAVVRGRVVYCKLLYPGEQCVASRCAQEIHVLQAVVFRGTVCCKPLYSVVNLLNEVNWISELSFISVGR